MEFTGERFTTDCVREIWYEHWHRYAFALQFVAGKSVLDLACGEGYGSALLASVAADVVGVDLAKQAIDHANEKYQRANLSFMTGDATAIPLAAASVDVVVSFETLEHLLGQREMLAEFRRVLHPDGVLIISTPDKQVYSEIEGVSNEFHVKELYREEFEQLLQEFFPAYRLFGQKLLFQSVMWAQNTADDADATVRASALDGALDSAALTAGLSYRPTYLIALAASQPELLPPAASTDLFGDLAESVYQHYNHEVRKNIQAGTILAEREAELERLRKRRRPFWQRWLGGKGTDGND